MGCGPERGRLIRAAVVVGGIGMVVLVARDGSPAWSGVRAMAVIAVGAGLAHALPAPSQRRTGVLEWITGTVLTAVGTGIALPHLTKTGVDGPAVAGVLAFLGGLVLVVDGTARLVRSTRRWQRPFVAGALLVVLLVALLSLGQAVAATNVPRTGLGGRDPGDLGLEYQDVTFRTGDGVRLAGWYVPSRNGAAVVLLHGAGSTRAAVLPQAAVLAAHGYGLLLLDARGHGQSEGRAMDFGWYGDQDVAAAVSFLASRPEVVHARIAALGLSMGGEEAIGAAAADPRIRAVVAEGATNRVAADKAWLPREHGVPGVLQQGIDRLTYGVTDLLTEASPPPSLRSAATAAAPTPMLLIAGGAVEDEAPAARYIAAGAPDTVQVWIAPGSSHTAAVRSHPAEWEARVTRFFAEALADAG